MIDADFHNDVKFADENRWYEDDEVPEGYAEGQDEFLTDDPDFQV